MDELIWFGITYPGEALALLTFALLLSIYAYDQLSLRVKPSRSAAEQMEDEWRGDRYARDVAAALRASETRPRRAAVRRGCGCRHH